MKVNQLKAGVILSYVSIVLTNGISIIYTPIMLRMLGQNEYGLFQLAYSVVSYLGLLNFGFGSAYIRFYSRYKKDNDEDGIARLNGMFMICFLTMSLLAIIFGTILILNVDNIFSNGLTQSELVKMRKLMILMVFNVAIMFPNSVYNANITAHERYLFQRVLSLVSSILNPLLVLMLLIMGFKSEGLVFAATIVAVTKLSADIYYNNKYLHIKFCFKRMEVKLLKEVSAFSFFIFINMLTDTLNYSVDKFVLGMVRTTKSIAIYSIGASLNQYYISFSAAISTVFIPRVNRMIAKEEENDKITDLFIKVGRIQFIVISLILSGFIVFGQTFIRIWAGEGYQNAYWIALIIMVPTTVPLIQNISIEIQRAKNMHKFRSIVYLCIAIGNFAISIPLAKHFGEVGSAIGTSIAVILGNVIIMNIYNYKKVEIDIPRFWREIEKIVLPVLFVGVIGYVIARFIAINNIIIFFVSAAVYCALFFGVMWIKGFNEYEKDIVRSFCEKIFKKRKKVLI
ncbi:MAG: polysaccharide biosynthesis protein [Lachnospiraceae bacterium]|nr:polysaccharide biosynthesis protein [Lachnospiraceae bacterium]